MFKPSTSLTSRAWVEVHTDRLRDNLLSVRQAVGPDVGLIPMVKAEAYGLGMVDVAAALRAFPAPDDPWAFGVAAVAEGEGLRDAGWNGRILIFSPVPPLEYARAADASLTPCLSSVGSVEIWRREAERVGERLPFHIEIDTGMGRAGLWWEDAPTWGPRVVELSRDVLQWEGIYTHFHSADEPPAEPTAIQFDRLQSALSRLDLPSPAPLIHAANSAAIFRERKYALRLVRPGIFLYGGDAGEARPSPVAHVRARVSLIKDVDAGATAGYGATYTAKSAERWGTLSIGYGDGIPRALSTGGGEVIVRGRRVPIIGRVSMDMITINLTDCPDVRVGDAATLIGESEGLEITLDEVARRCGTISYEILTGLTSRLPRVYLSGNNGTDEYTT